ncbi:MAG TPA: carbohydrate ABC transporter substrate-binding protein [Firmicutes bacterium]|jgi:multiple sugar transport system substrate-binding protein|nr:carbohydrate ABC transporter substrate-binding protein [Bacillota bacterium]
MSRRTVFLASVALLALLTCAAAVSAEEVIRLQFWSGVPAENGPLEAVEKWNALNPHIQVTYNRYVNNDEGNLRVNIAMQTGEAVDILMSHSANDYEQRVRSGLLLDLSDRLDEDYLFEKIGSGALRWKIDGAYYALPTNINAIFVMINEDVLTAKGLEVPEKLTVEELRELALALKSPEFEYTFALDAGNIHGIIQHALIDVGFVGEDGKSNLDHPNVRLGLETFYKMMYEDKTMPILAVQKATNMAPEQMFLKGELPLYQAGAWRLRMSNDLAQYPRDFTIAFCPYPYFEGYSIPGHHIEDAMSITAHCKYPDAAWEFIQWWAVEGMMALAPGGRVPAHTDAPQAEARKLIVSGAEDTYNLESLDRTYEMENTKLIPVPPYQVLDYINQEIEKYFLGEQSLDDTIANMVKFHNEFLERQ